MSTPAPAPAPAGEATAPEGWLVSDWAAGPSATTFWAADHAQADPAGGMRLVLGPAAPGGARPFAGAEVRTRASAATGAFRWTAQAPRLREGAVFGLFAYRGSERDPWREFDLEFVGADSRRVRLNIHMEDEGGRRVTLEQARGGPVVVDLGFDAAEGLHGYGVTVTDHGCAFEVDGREVGRFGPEDLPGGSWGRGRLRAFANLWAADAARSGWAGRFDPAGPPLVARVAAMDLRPGGPRRRDPPGGRPTRSPAASPGLPPARGPRAAHDLPTTGTPPCS